MFLGICILVVSLFKFRVVRPRLTIYVCQESQQAREQHPKHENGDAAASTFFGQCTSGSILIIIFVDVQTFLF